MPTPEEILFILQTECLRGVHRMVEHCRPTDMQSFVVKRCTVCGYLLTGLTNKAGEWYSPPHETMPDVLSAILFIST